MRELQWEREGKTILLSPRRMRHATFKKYSRTNLEINFDLCCSCFNFYNFFFFFYFLLWLGKRCILISLVRDALVERDRFSFLLFSITINHERRRRRKGWERRPTGRDVLMSHGKRNHGSRYKEVQNSRDHTWSKPENL